MEADSFLVMAMSMKDLDKAIPNELAALLRERRDIITENIDFGIVRMNDDGEISNWHSVLINAVMMSDAVDDYIRDYCNDRCSRDEYGWLMDKAADYVDEENIVDYNSTVDEYLELAQRKEYEYE